MGSPKLIYFTLKILWLFTPRPFKIVFQERWGMGSHPTCDNYNKGKTLDSVYFKQNITSQTKEQKLIKSQHASWNTLANNPPPALFTLQRRTLSSPYNTALFPRCLIVSIYLISRHSHFKPVCHGALVFCE